MRRYARRTLTLAPEVALRTPTAALLLTALLTGCIDPLEVEVGDVIYDFDFQTQPLGWTAGFSDYPAAIEAEMELVADHRLMPIGEATRGLYSAGTNHSDDLFMFWKRRITGLLPLETYRISFDVQFATSAPAGCVGVGGAPGESVFVKVGGSAGEPRSVLTTVGGEPFEQFSLDKGNQAEDGSDGATLGTIESTNTDCDAAEWEYRTLSTDAPVEVTTDANGALWLFVGTDSGFEGRSEIYWRTVRVVFESD